MCTLTVRGNSFHKQRHSCPHSFSPGFFHSLHSSSSSLPFFFFFYKHHCSVKCQGIAVKATKALRVHQSVSSPERKYWCYHSTVNQDKWSLDPGSLQAGRGRGSSAECTNTVQATLHICKMHTIHHLTGACDETPTRKIPRTLRGISMTQRSCTTAQVRSASPSNNSRVCDALCSPSELNERMLSPVTPVYWPLEIRQQGVSATTGEGWRACA